MLCERCGKQPATFHLQQNINGQQTEAHLCAQCAAEQGEFMPGLEPQLKIQQFLAGLLHQAGFGPEGLQAPAAQSQRCSHCGISYAEFAQSGLLGCAQCYETFAPQLQPLLRRMHGSATHRGRYPARGGRSLKVKRRAAMLREQLQDAIAKEEFERAAVLRDEIRALEAEGGDGGDGH